MDTRKTDVRKGIKKEPYRIRDFMCLPDIVLYLFAEVFISPLLHVFKNWNETFA